MMKISKSFETEETCLLCKASPLGFVTDVLRDSENKSILRCSKCNLYQLSPLPSDDDIKAYYNSPNHSIRKENIEALNRKESLSLEDTIRRADLVASLIAKGRLLDFGFGYGFFLKEMNRRGYQISGVELSPIRIESSMKLETKGRLCNSINSISNGTQDIVTIFHVLEHVRDPVALIKELSMKLREEGTLIIEVPNVEDALMRHSKAYRNFHWKIAHISYFNEHTLSSCIQKSGTCYLEEIKYTQRWNVCNLMNWILRSRPQTKEEVEKYANYNGPFRWLDKCYKDYITKNKQSDTLVAICKRF